MSYAGRARTAAPGRAGRSRLGRRFLFAMANRSSPAGWRWPTATTTPKRASTGTQPIADEVRAQIRTRVAVELFGEKYGRPPADDRELSGFIARNTRARTTAVAGYDLTFSPVKSVSALWAIAPLHGSRADRGRPRRARWPTCWSGYRTRRPSPAPAPTASPRSTPTGLDRRGVHPPRLARRRPRPAHPCGGVEQGVARRRRRRARAGWHLTVNPCTGSPWPPPSCTTPGSRHT